MPILEEIRPRAFAVAYRMLGSVSEAEDIVQEAVLRLHHLLQQASRSSRHAPIPRPCYADKMPSTQAVTSAVGCTSAALRAGRVNARPTLRRRWSSGSEGVDDRRGDSLGVGPTQRR